MNGYTRICAESQRRQPVIVSKNEIDSYDKETFNNTALEFGKDNKGDSLYYICPRFWCTMPGKEGPLTQKQVDEGVCGKIIQKPSNPQEGEYVYTRDYSTYSGKEIRGAPSFVQQKDASGKKVCYPCCFKNQDEKKIKECKSETNSFKVGSYAFPGYFFNSSTISNAPSW